MSGSGWVDILPLMTLAATPLAVMLLVAVKRHYLLSTIITFVGLALSFALLPVVTTQSSRQATPLFVIDNFSLFYMGILFTAALTVVVLSYRYLKERAGNLEEYWMLLLLATLGSSILVASTHFASFFLGLEILSISLYALVGYNRASAIGTEAAVKYLVLAAASTAFLLFGMALVYAEIGSMEFSQIASAQGGLTDGARVFFLSGLGLIGVGIGFKLAVVPFHMWAPDVYQGAPAPITAFIATVSKGGVFAILLRFFTLVNFQTDSSLFWIFSIIAIASMFAGNLLALLQNNVKRILAYSSISHFGYLLVAFLAAGNLRVTAVTLYLIVYFIANVGAFAVVTALSTKERDADRLEDFRGLFWTRPYVAGIFSGMLLSLAGMPFTAGFVGKFYLVAAGAQSSLWGLIIILVLTSVIGLFYYTRIILVMYQKPESEEQVRVPFLAALVSPTDGFVLLMSSALAVWLGIFPSPLIHIIPTIVG
jgi:NADH-quinone oxidoreductase subunit N